MSRAETFMWYCYAALWVCVLSAFVVLACQSTDGCTEPEENACLADWLECEMSGLPDCEPLYCDCLSKAGCEGSSGWLMVCEPDPPSG